MTLTTLGPLEIVLNLGFNSDTDIYAEQDKDNIIRINGKTYNGLAFSFKRDEKGYWYLPEQFQYHQSKLSIAAWVKLREALIDWINNFVQRHEIKELLRKARLTAIVEELQRIENQIKDMQSQIKSLEDLKAKLIVERKYFNGQSSNQIL